MGSCDKFCCFIPLRTTSFIMGYLHLIISLIGTVASVIVICVGSKYGGGLLAFFSAKDNEESSFFSVKGVTSSVLSLKETALSLFSLNLLRNFLSNITLACGAFMFLILFISLIFCIILLIGLHRKKPAYLMAYMVFLLVVSIILIIVALLLQFVVTVLFGVPGLVAWTILAVLVCVMCIYLLSVFYRYYGQLKQEIEQSGFQQVASQYTKST